MPKTASSFSALNWALVGFALSLLIPSTAVVQKYSGVAGVLVYLVVASVILVLVRHGSIRTGLTSRLAEKQVLWLMVLTFGLVLVAFMAVYPIANSGVVGGGSDGDDALNLAATELMNGRYPYCPKTYLGNAISPLPGALLRAMPFVLLGNSAYQNFFWLLVFFFSMRSYLKDARFALLLLWALLIFSPAVLHNLLIGSDYVSNGLYVLLFTLWMVTSLSQPQPTPGWKSVVLAILLGIGLSSRAIFILILPLVFSALVRKAGWKPAIKYTAITSAAFLAITVPFYLYDPLGFSPLHTVQELGQFQSVMPFAGFIIPLVAGLIAIVPSLARPTSRDHTSLFRKCTIVLAFPVLCGIDLDSIARGRVYFGFASFGVFFLFFGAVGSWEGVFEA